MRRSAPKVRPSSRPAKPIIDGAAMRVALQRYGRSEISVEALLDELRSLNVADKPARQLAHAFRPRQQTSEAS